MVNQSPKVSIGMPVYNMENTVQEAIDTILGQTFTDFQLLISDNASDDGTEEICRTAESQDSRVTYFRCPENIPSENFHRTLVMSTGKYFMWAAADDSRRPKMVARCVEALEADQAAVMAYTHTELLDQITGKRTGYSDPLRLDQEDPAERYVSLIQSLNLGNALYGLYRRSVLIDIPPFYRSSSRFISWRDIVFLTNVVLQGKVVQIPEMLFIRRVGKSETGLERTALYERGFFPNYLTNGVTLPMSETVQELVRYVMSSTLSVETKLRLTRITYEVFVKRCGNVLSFEIDRAGQLAKAGRFMETWNGMPEMHPDEKVQNLIDQYYAGLLLERLERTGRFVKNHQGIHLGKACCLAKMGRVQEAKLQLAHFKKLVLRKATQKQEAKSKVSSKT